MNLFTFCLPVSVNFQNIESMRQTLASIFNYSLDSSETDLPFGTHTIMQMAEIVLPKNVMTL